MNQETHEQPNGHRKILIVDDEVKICRMLSEHFSLQGYEVSTARRGEDAMTMAYLVRPQVVLLDLLMPGPGMSGIDTLKQLKQLAPPPKIIMISAADHEEVIQGALNLGADRYVCKPLNLLELDLLVKDYAPLTQ